MTFPLSRVEDLPADARWPSKGIVTSVPIATILIAAATVVGLALRLAAARGDLWLDELWSLDLASKVTSPDQVFWKIAHDNNHFLNTFWMALVGQKESPLTYRLPSIVLSTISILVAARIGSRVNAAAAIAAACLTSVSYAFVDYGSEARGYAGLMLAVLLAIDLSRSLLDRTCAAGPHRPEAIDTTRTRWVLGLVIALGTCSHLTMVGCAAILGMTAVFRLRAAGWPLRAAIDTAISLFRPALLLLLPVVACVVTATTLQGGFGVGGNAPYSLGAFANGYGGLLAALLGLSDVAPAWLAGLVALAGVAAALGSGLLDRSWMSLALSALLILPGAILLSHVNNIEYARYYFVAGLVLPIFLAEIAGRLWVKGGIARLAGCALVACVCAGQIPDLVRLLAWERGSPAAAVALMTSEGPALYRANYPLIVGPVVTDFATKLGVTVAVADAKEACAKPADWLIYDTDYAELAPSGPEIGPAGCRHRYAFNRTFPAPRWSGRTWTLYHRLP